MSKTAPRRLRFGLLINTLNGVYQSAIWNGLSEFAQAGDYDFVSFVGREIGHPDYESDAYNHIYQLALNEKLDGLFMVSSTIGTYIDTAQAERYFKPFRKFPIVNIGHPLAGIPRVGSDNRSGMQDLLEHFLGHHGYRRVAFVRGPANNHDSDERFVLYLQALRAHGLELDENLVFPGLFNVESGKAAARQLIRDGKPTVEAVIAANDEMALGVMQVFWDAGIRIPQDVAVAGFDNEEEIRFLPSPLTTVSQSYRRITEAAGRIMLDLVAGRPAPELELVPSELVVRQSCGCAVDCGQTEPFLREAYDKAADFFVGLYADGAAGADSWKNAIHARIWTERGQNQGQVDWHLALNQARLRLLAAPRADSPSVERFFQAGLQTISHLQTQTYQREVVFQKDLILAISDFIQNVNFSLDEEATLDALPYRSKYLQVNGFALFVYPRPLTHQERSDRIVLKRMYSLDGGLRPKEPGTWHRSDRALPQDMLDRGSARQLLHLPIVNHGLKFGWISFQTSPTQYYIYGIIQEQLGILLNREHLAREIIQKRTQQAIEQEKMASTRILVAGIAHDLNTPIGITLTATSYLGHQLAAIQRLFEQGKLTQGKLKAFLADSLEANRIMQSNLERTVNLIQSFKRVSVDNSNETKRRFKLKEYIRDVATALSPRYRHIDLAIDIDCPDDLEIDSYPGAFAQILTNLLENCLLHAFGGRSSGSVRIAAALDGDSLVVRFGDDGAGMPRDVAARAFEPFFTTKRNAGGSGLGLHIAYNLVTQQLGGTIDCQSSPGKGSLFTIRIPVAAGKAGR